MYLQERERYEIEFMLKEGYSPKEIAKRLNRHISTIYREIKRGQVEMVDSNLKPYVKYCADTAQAKYEQNRLAKGASLKIGNDYELAGFIEDKIINEKYSPQAVLLYIKNNGLNFKTELCFKTIYNYIDKGIFLKLSNKHLPVKTGRKKRSHKSRISVRNALKRSIEVRPDEVKKRQIPGHWEMDTVCSAKGFKDCLLVLSERVTRNEIIIKIPDHTASSVVDALDDLEKRCGSRFKTTFKTITVDNGIEFSDMEGIERSIDGISKRTTLYYCHAYSSYERGTNENINRMIRRFIPKGSDIGKYTVSQIQKIQDWLNNYPRKILGGLSANQYSRIIGFNFE